MTDAPADKPDVEVRVPGSRYRATPDMTILWEKLGTLLTVAFERMPDDDVFSVAFARVCREMRRRHGIEATKEVLAGLLLTQEEAAENDRPRT